MLHVVLTVLHSIVGFMIKTAQKHLWLRCQPNRGVTKLSLCQSQCTLLFTRKETDKNDQLVT